MVSQESQVLLLLRESGVTRTVGLIADTHIPVRARELPRKIFEVFDKVDFIIHAGDLVDLSVIDELEQLAPVLAVYGNMDGPKIRGKLSKMNSVKVFNWKIGVIHDPRAFFGMRKMREIAKQYDFNVLVYGHTHNPRIKWEGETLFINPGSPTNPLPPIITKPTVALLRITKAKIMPEIVHI
jgi:putative phosphoesterase